MKNANELIHETSPYLLQHAHNPVQWKAWNDKSLNQAQKENKPLLISIGYAACHWCHVMEQETFEDKEAADLMNENFICIKVDREEHPDVDQIYMAAAQLINGSGGWPLNAFAFPDGKPFFAGTYFPKKRWMDLLKYFIGQYRENHDAVREQAEHLSKGIHDFHLVGHSNEAPDFSEKHIETIQENLLRRIDSQNGGILGNIKFPMPSVWDLMIRFDTRNQDENISALLGLTLHSMANGGIYDQLGGGFSRYATDTRWIVPHFEKMLYDNAQLISLYSHAFQLTEDKIYKKIVEETIGFVVGELAADKGYFASIDADSDGKEGEYYVWSFEEIKDVLKENAASFMETFGVSTAGNFENGKNVLFRNKEGSWGDPHVDLLRKELLDARIKRNRPGIDNKVLTSWNAMMSSAFTEAGKVFGSRAYLDKSKNILDFLLTELLMPGNELYRNYQNGKAATNAFLDDYAFLIKALIDYYQVTFEFKYLDKSRELTEYVLEHFSNEENKMFYYNNNRFQKVFTRPTEFMDDVIPSSNSVMAENLQTLGKIFHQDLWEGRAATMVKNMKQSILAEPTYYSNWAKVMIQLVRPQFEIAIVGNRAKDFLKDFHKHYLPDCTFCGSTEESKLPLLQQKYVQGKTLIYVCVNRSCKRPVGTVEEALEQINEG